MIIHTFGAYYGLAASYFFQNRNAIKSQDAGNGGTHYTSNIFAFVGSIFLWLYWPSFNGALAGARQEVTAINTVIAIAASAAWAVILSKVICGHLNVEVVLNATLAGGVAIGSIAD